MNEQFKRELAAWDLGHESRMDEAEEAMVSVTTNGEWVDGWPADSVDIVDVRAPNREELRSEFWRGYRWCGFLTVAAVLIVTTAERLIRGGQ